MERRIRFRLNETLHDVLLDQEVLALDWIRGVAGLKGTKEGCREGDCGACLVLLGGPDAEGCMEWYSATSCTMAMSDLDGRHIITIEGLASAGLTAVMTAMLDTGASQCGFCSPGFVLALTGCLISGQAIDAVSMMTAVEGNLCRCTGYGSIRRAAEGLAADFRSLPAELPQRLDYLAERGVLPASLASYMIAAPEPAATMEGLEPVSDGTTLIGGGTDFFVRHPDPDAELSTMMVDRSPGARRIVRIQADGQDWLELGAAVTMREFFSSPLVGELVPGIAVFEAEIASPPIRNRATLAGNIANASPIADMTTMLLALDASLVLRAEADRVLSLSKFFLGYKKIDLRSGELIAAIRLPWCAWRFNFEKAAKRARLDIATVNSALGLCLDASGTVLKVACSAGGIAATPLRLEAVEALLLGTRLPPERGALAGLFAAAGRLAAEAGTPMSDVRGSSQYRRRLMERMLWAHGIRLWPELGLEEELLV